MVFSAHLQGWADPPPQLCKIGNYNKKSGKEELTRGGRPDDQRDDDVLRRAAPWPALSARRAGAEEAEGA
jgi:hypothetical protein